MRTVSYASPGDTALRRRVAWQRTRSTLTPYFFVAPSLFVVLLLIVFPLLADIWFSLHNGILTSRDANAWVGLSHYQSIIRDPDVQSAVLNSFLYAIGSSVMATVVGFLWALLLNQPLRFQSLFRVVALTPWIMSGIIVGRVWRWMVDPEYGYLNRLLDLAIFYPLGIHHGPISWVGNPHLVWFVVIGATVWGRFPFAFIMFLASLQTIPHDLYEAAMVDGASGFQRLWYITIPRLRLITLVVSLLLFINTFNDFGTIFVLTYGGPANATMVLPFLIYQTISSYLWMGTGAAMALLVVICLAIFSAFYLAVFRQRSAEEV